jgi:N-acetylglucosamine kinase-like BadF-type ATPase
MFYIAGVDSGGTHTNIRVLTSEGNQVAVRETDNSLTSNRSDEELASIFQEIFTEIRTDTFGHDTFVWISAAGYANSTRERFVGLLQSSVDRSGSRIGMCNDGVTLLLGNDDETVIVIAGTGSVAMGRAASGKMITRGGDEWVAADFGSAFWIGLNGIRAAYQDVEGGRETALRRCLAEHYRPLNARHSAADAAVIVRAIVRDLAGQGTDTKPRIASFARQVTRQAELGDEVAQTIVRQAAEELAAMATRVYRELAEHARPRVVPPHFLLNGSVASMSRFYAETFRASLNQFLFDVRQAPDQTVDLTIQLNGTSQALELARRLAANEAIRHLDDAHSYSIID